jgi:Bacteriophage holin of superfamily 6 (Holin_LLH)
MLETLINYLAPTAVGIILCAAAATAGTAYQKAVQNLPASVRAQVTSLAAMVTNAIEQKYLANSPGGALKKQEAMQMLLQISQHLGIPLDATHASAAIESAVYTMNLYSHLNASNQQDAR